MWIPWMRSLFSLRFYFWNFFFRRLAWHEVDLKKYIVFFFMFSFVCITLNNNVMSSKAPHLHFHFTFFFILSFFLLQLDFFCTCIRFMHYRFFFNIFPCDRTFYLHQQRLASHMRFSSPLFIGDILSHNLALVYAEKRRWSRIISLFSFYKIIPSTHARVSPTDFQTFFFLFLYFITSFFFVLFPSASIKSF